MPEQVVLVAVVEARHPQVRAERLPERVAGWPSEGAFLVGGSRWPSLTESANSRQRFDLVG